MDELLDREFTGIDDRPKGRGSFLLVLCILSFIGIPLMALRHWYLYTVYSEMTGISKLMPGYIFQEYEHARPIVLCQVTSNVLELAGVVAMLLLRKWGFYLYAAAQVSEMVVPAAISHELIYGSAYAGFFGFFEYVISAISFGFIVMYYLNLKRIR